MGVKSAAKAAFRRAGFEVSRYPSYNSLEGCVASVLRSEGVELVLDVGAFRGDYCRSLRHEMGYTGKIISFEPCAASFQALHRSMLHDPGWTGANYGLSDTDALAILNTFNAGRFNSVLHLRDPDASAYGVLTETKVGEQIQLRRLESVWDETVPAGSSRVFLKIDTQGHDAAIIAGAGSCLDYVVGIQTEMPAVEIYDGMTPMHEILRLCSEVGFVPIGFYPVNRPQSYGGIAPEFDVVLKRQSLRAQRSTECS